MMLQTHHHHHARAAAVARTAAPVPSLRLPLRSPSHIVRFKEGEQTDEQQQDTTAQGHKDAIARSKAALQTLLGRASSSTSTNSSTSTSSSSVQQPQQVRSSRTPAFEASLSVPVFSRRREVLVGRVAMAAFYATSQWEVLTGLGPLSQASVSTGLPRLVVQGLLAAFVLHGLWGFSPTTPTWSSQNRHDLLRRPRGVPRAIVNPFKEPARFFAFSEWGFTKANEVFAGRLAMLGWLGVALVEPWSGGKGPLGQVAWWLHLPTFPLYYQAAGILLVALPIAFGALAYVNRRPGQVAGGDDVY